MALAAILAPLAACFSDDVLFTPVPQATREEMAKIYDAAIERIKRCSPGLAPVAKKHQELDIRFIQPDWTPKVIAVLDVDCFVKVWASSMRWVSVVNGPVFNKYGGTSAMTNSPGAQTIPTLSREAAIQRAKEYLRVFRIDVPPDYKPDVVDFNEWFRFGWHICWHRFSGQYSWDCYDAASSTSSESVDVKFHEKDGLACLGSDACCPAPKRLVVKISREEAIAKATRCVPLLQHSLFYRERRLDGFVVKSVRSCELRVSAPDWWFDPKRAVFIRHGPPPETRLCWKIWFETMDSKLEERRRKGQLGLTEYLMSPEMFIYIDAETGEAVGANST